MANFYTNVQCLGGSILYRGINDGKRVKEKINYRPSLFMKNKSGNFRTLEGHKLEEIKFESIKDAKNFVKGYEGVHGAPTIYGQTRYEYAYIGDNFTGMPDYDLEKILIAYVDIEVGSENGFPDPYEAKEPITAITVWYTGEERPYVFGCGEYKSDGSSIYTKCKDEWSLCKAFLKLWAQKYPDIITGWSTEFFDIPYIVNRFRKILGEDDTKKLSPWNFITDRKAFVNNKQMTTYSITGISSLDYIELYKWYAPGGKSQESYKLNNIANVELGEGKISYDEYDSLHQLYKLDYQKFIDYNIKDVALVMRLEDKLRLLELAITLAYDTKSNFDDVFAQTRMWDALTYCNLFEQGIIVPPRVIKEKTSAFEGAYVKEPQIGLHPYIASFDLNSLYPHLMMQYSISPENLVERSYIEERKQKLIHELKLRNTK